MSQLRPNLCVLIFRLVLKEEASDYLELETIKNLVRKYSQFINFPIYVWASKVISEELSPPTNTHTHTPCLNSSAYGNEHCNICFPPPD